jgi:hypothetical protein
MKKITSFFLAAGLCFHNIASGENETQCSKYPEVTRNAWPYFTDAQCDCGSNLSIKYEYKEPSNMTLVAVCNFRKNDRRESYGGFFFRGSDTTTATLERQDTPSGVGLYFGGWKFIEEDVAIDAFKVPRLSKTAPCWTTEATVELTQLLIMVGPGTDEDGGWPLKHRVLKVGNYKACKPGDF